MRDSIEHDFLAIMDKLKLLQADLEYNAEKDTINTEDCKSYLSQKAEKIKKLRKRLKTLHNNTDLKQTAHQYIKGHVKEQDFFKSAFTLLGSINYKALDSNDIRNFVMGLSRLLELHNKKREQQKGP